MPAPVVWVVGIVATAGALYAFKEFVYDPHLAPKLEAWMASRRRQVPVPGHDNGRESPPPEIPGRRPRPPPQGPPSPGRNDAMSVELEDLVANEAAEWRSTGRAPHQGTLRQRGRGQNVMDEPNPFLPYDPLDHSQVLFDSSDAGTASPFQSPLSLPSRTLPSSPAPGPAAPLRTPATSPRASTHQHLASPPVPPTHHAALPHLPTPVSPRSPDFSRTTSPAGSQLYQSVSSASSFTPVVVGPQRAGSTYASSRSSSAVSIGGVSEAGRSVISVPASSRVTSPFSDIHAVQVPRSPMSLQAPSPQAQRSTAASSAGARSPEVRPAAARSPSVRSPAASATVRSPTIRSPLHSPRASSDTYSDVSSPLILSPTLSSDFEFPLDADELEHMMISPEMRSGMFSPPTDSNTREIHYESFEVGPAHGTDDGWSNVRRQTLPPRSGRGPRPS